MRLAIVGYGRMGRAVEAVALERGHEIAFRAGSARALQEALDNRPPAGNPEVAVEFTHPDAAPEVVTALAEAGIPVVSGTTGWDARLPEVGERVRAAAGGGLLHAANFSLGVHLFLRLVEEAGRLVDRLEEYDIHVSEVHHRHKVDHPSGTARRVAELLVGRVDRKRDWREGPGEGPADPGLLQVASVRAGENPGTHLVGLEGPDDRLEIRHEARGRTGFARGAVVAAEWLRGRTGVFTMDDLLAQRLG